LSKSVKIRIYKTIILSAVLYGCETWYLTLREEHMLRVFQNRMLRGIFGPKKDEVMGEGRKLNNEQFRDLYSSPSIIRMIKSRRMRWAVQVAQMDEKRNAYRLLGYWWESQRERDREEDQDVSGLITLGWILERWDGVMWTGVVWLRIGTSGELL
jgi:hypothetical protein